MTFEKSAITERKIGRVRRLSAASKGFGGRASGRKSSEVQLNKAGLQRFFVFLKPQCETFEAISKMLAFIFHGSGSHSLEAHSSDIGSDIVTSGELATLRV